VLRPWPEGLVGQRRVDEENLARPTAVQSKASGEQAEPLRRDFIGRSSRTHWLIFHIYLHEICPARKLAPLKRTPEKVQSE